MKNVLIYEGITYTSRRVIGYPVICNRGTPHEIVNIVSDDLIMNRIRPESLKVWEGYQPEMFIETAVENLKSYTKRKKGMG